jgi:hypothetical protein
MGRWSQRMLRGGSHAAAISAAQLFNDTGTGIFWDFTGPEPPFWHIEQSNDGLTGWVAIDDVPGSQLAYNSTTNAKWYRVQAQDADSNPVGDFSNAVQYFD